MNISQSYNLTDSHTSTLEYFTDYILGSLLLCMTPVGLVGNGLAIVLFTSRKRRHIHSRTTYLIRSLAISDAIMALVGGSMFSINSFQHRWTFGERGCTIYAVIMFWCGVTSISHLTAIAIERCITMSNPIWSMANKGKIPVYVRAMVVICWGYGLFWAVLPFAGVQGYTIEGRVSCSLDWFNKDTRYQVYNTVLFATTFFIPAFIITCCNVIIYRMVKTSLLVTHNNDRLQRENCRTESQLARTMVFSTVFYITAWFPYALISIWTSFGDSKAVPSILFTWLGFLAKTSFIFNPLIYVCSNTQYRCEMLKWLVRREWLDRCCKNRIRTSSTIRSASEGSTIKEIITLPQHVLSAETNRNKIHLVSVSLSPNSSEPTSPVTVSLLSRADSNEYSKKTVFDLPGIEHGQCSL